MIAAFEVLVEQPWDPMSSAVQGHIMSYHDATNTVLVPGTWCAIDTAYSDQQKSKMVLA